MNICFALGSMYGLFNKKIAAAAGGSEKQLYLIVKDLEKRGIYKLNCLSYDFGQPALEEYGSVMFFKTFSLKENKLSGFLRFIKVLMKVNADLYITRSPGYTTFFCFFVSKYVLKKRMWYMLAHDCETAQKELAKEIGSVAAFLMNYVFKYADIVTTQTNFQKQRLSKRDIEVTGIIPNIYDITIDEREIESASKDTILWVGRCEKWKQPELFIEMARKFPEQKFVMVCPKVQDRSKHSYWDHIYRLAQNEKNITFFEYLPHEKLRVLYLSARVYVLTSLQEGFSNSMMEAMESTCPILSLYVNPDNIIDLYHLGYCAAGDRGMFYEKFQELMEDRELCRTMGSNGRDYLAKKHTKENIMDEIENLITKE